MVIMLGYVIWDIITKIVIPYPSVTLRGFRERGYVSLLCALMAILAFRRFKCIPPDCRRSVLLADAALISLFLFFRAMKQYEHWLTLGEPQAKIPTPTPDSEVPFEYIVSIVFIVAFILASPRSR